jgi:hypothetical protein
MLIKSLIGYFIIVTFFAPLSWICCKFFWRVGFFPLCGYTQRYLVGVKSRKTYINIVGFDVLTATSVKRLVFRDVTRGKSTDVAAKQCPSSWLKSKQSKKSSLFLCQMHRVAWLTLQYWRWRRYVPPKFRLTFTGLHGVLSHAWSCS